MKLISVSVITNLQPCGVEHINNVTTKMKDRGDTLFI